MRFTKSLSTYRFHISSLFALNLALMALLSTSASAAPSSWSSEPAWANDSATTTSKRAQQREAVSANTSTPFSPGSSNIAIDLGQVFLMGDLASSYEDNLGAQIHYTYGVSDMFGFDASLGHSSHSDGRYSLTTLLTGLRTNLSWYDRVIPYAVFGLGFYKPSMEVTPASSISPMIFGLHFGPGIDLQLTRNLFFGSSLTFHDMFGTTKRTANGVIDVGGSYTAFLLHAGMSF